MDKISLARLEHMSSVAAVAVTGGAVVIPASGREGGWRRRFGGQ
jgi:hypothetical protein